jgi:SAM-dependent methyltransferase
MFKDKHTNWFEDWFNSPYYHILYKNRNCNEAEVFIDNLVRFLQPVKNSRFLDLACGKGRHSFYLNKKGFDVTGIDLSEQSIACANHFVKKTSDGENEHLHFYVHDMRKIVRINYFDYVLNLFTSFGYFENDRDDNAVVDSGTKALKSNGTFVIDFMNTKKVLANLTENEIKVIEHIEFKINKKIENNFIVKQIRFSDKGKDYNFQERVKMLTRADFEKYLTASKLKTVHLFGSYRLDEFNENDSDRLIIIAKKQ